MIYFLVNVAINLRSKTNQNSTQEASKIDKTGCRKYDVIRLGMWSPLCMILGGFWGQVVKQVGAKLAPKSEPLVP